MATGLCEVTCFWPYFVVGFELIALGLSGVATAWRDIDETFTDLDEVTSANEDRSLEVRESLGQPRVY